MPNAEPADGIRARHVESLIAGPADSGVVLKVGALSIDARVGERENFG